jgi:O-antigen biosynthesis protein WbqP
MLVTVELLSRVEPMPVLKRILDIFLALVATAIFAMPMLLVATLILLTSPGPVLYWSDRVGRDNKIFSMPKFRTMRPGTPAVATHLMEDPRAYLTPIGSFLRKSSIDELPQIWSVLRDDMSFVGPRPALFNQVDLIELRTQAGVHHLTPGLTGWAQVRGRDELSIPEKVRLDAEYLERRSFGFDLWILWLTVVKVIKRDGVSH